MEKNQKLKKSSEPHISRQNICVNINDPLIKTSPIRTQIEMKKATQIISLQDLMDSAVLCDQVPAKIEDKSESGMQTTKEAILERVITMQFHEVLNIERSMMKDIIQKDSEREKFLRELKCKLDLLQSEHQILTAENKSLKEMMAIWKIQN